jgi:fatty acid desaturase
MDNPFSWDYLTTVPGPNEVFGPFAVIFLVLFGLGFIVSIILYNGGGRRFIKDPILARMARKWSAWALIVFTFGLFVFVIRWLQINPLTLGMRIWMWISFVALLGLIGYAIYDYRQHYEEEKAAYEESRARRHIGKRAPGAAAVTRGQQATIVAAPKSRPVRRRRR